MSEFDINKDVLEEVRNFIDFLTIKSGGGKNIDVISPKMGRRLSLWTPIVKEYILNITIPLDCTDGITNKFGLTGINCQLFQRYQ